MSNDERIPNLASELKLDNIRPLFWPKTGKMPDYLIFGPKGESNVIRFEFRGHIWNPHII